MYVFLHTNVLIRMYVAAVTNKPQRSLCVTYVRTYVNWIVHESKD